MMKLVPGIPWVVHAHYWVRSVSFAWAFLIVAAHTRNVVSGPLFWSLLALQFLVYPQALWWHVRRAADPWRAEKINLWWDSILLGIWSAVLGFPLWIAFMLFITSSINNAVSRGWRGIRTALAAYAVGAAFALIVQWNVWHFVPATDGLVTSMCIVGMSVYLLQIGLFTFGRNRRLRHAKQQMQEGELALRQANDELRQQLSEIHLLQDKLREQANRDPLTGLYNRRYLDTTLERELARCKREGHPLSLMMIDIDHFKQVNDTYGHQAGDEVLKRIGDMLTDNARAEDVACRYGGEEFLLLLPKMPLEVAGERAELWRRVFGEQVIHFGEFRMQATLSIGIAAYPGHGTSADELMRCADAALYAAKASGRNRVVVFGAAL